MSIRFDFACTEGHEFVLWSDDARLCPVCGSEFLKRIFLTAPGVTTERAKKTDQVLKSQIDAFGFSNMSSRPGEKAKFTRETDPKLIEAERAARAANIPFNPTAPIQTGAAGNLKNSVPVPTMNVKQLLGSRLGSTPEGQTVSGLIRDAGRIQPLRRQYPRVVHQDAASDRSDLKKAL